MASVIWATASGVAGLWRDDNGDNIPENFLGSWQNIAGQLQTGLGFDDQGNVFVHSISNDVIYRGVGDNPATIAPYINLPFNSNQSQGLFVWDDTGYYPSANQNGRENYSFATTAPPNLTLESTFGVPWPLLGDLTPVPEPASLWLLAVGGLALIRRRAIA